MLTFWLPILLAALLVAGCARRMPVIETLTPAPTLTVSPTEAAPAPEGTPTAPAAPAATSAPALVTLAPRPTPGPLTEPAVLARYPLEPGELGECLAVSDSTSPDGGRVWVGRADGQIEERSAADGSLRAVFPLTGGVDDARPLRIIDLTYDGAHLWAVGFDPLEAATWIVVLEPGGAVVQRIDASDDLPERLGLAPGQVWTQNRVFDTATLNSRPAPMTTDGTVFAADDRGRMWAAGTSACEACAAAIDLITLAAPAAAEPGPEASQDVRALAWAGGRMWALTALNQLHGYDLASADWQEPAARVDLSARLEAAPAAMLYDGAALWLLAGAGAGGGTLYRHDPRTGRQMGALAVGESEGETARVPLGLAFDGRDLWVLTALDLVRVGLPWTR